MEQGTQQPLLGSAQGHAFTLTCMCIPHTQTQKPEDKRAITSKQESMAVLVKVSIAVKRHPDHSNSYNRKHLTEVAAYSVSGPVHHHHHDKEHNCTQDDLVLK